MEAEKRGVWLRLPLHAHAYVSAAVEAGFEYHHATPEYLQLTRWRGQWDSMRSMEHYIQELASHEAFSRLPASARERMFRLAALLPALLAQ